MSIDQSLLQATRAGGGFLRLYRWNPPCLSFGRNEPAKTRYDTDRIRSLGLDTVRRPTGGRAVWHDRELTYAVAAPLDTFGSLQQTYAAIHHLLAAALRRLGVPASIAPHRSGRVPRLGSGACFAAPVGGEIVVGERKLVGSAQLREGNAFLQHGSVLMDGGQDMVASITSGPSLPIAATSLREVLQSPPEYEDVAQVIATEAERCWKDSWTRQTGSPDAVVGDKFGDSSWTWRR